MRNLTTAVLIGLGVSTFVFGQQPTPEIDPTSGVTALTLLGGAILLLRSRRKR